MRTGLAPAGRAILLAATFAGSAGLSGADPPRFSPIHAGTTLAPTIAPRHAPSDAPTELTLTGGGAGPGARLSLLGGGPFLLGSYIMPEGARGVEMHGDRACVDFYSHATKLGGIEILDLADPTSPVRL